MFLHIFRNSHAAVWEAQYYRPSITWLTSIQISAFYTDVVQCFMVFLNTLIISYTLLCALFRTSSSHHLPLNAAIVAGNSLCITRNRSKYQYPSPLILKDI